MKTPLLTTLASLTFFSLALSADAGVRAYYPFDSGSQFTDSSANSNDLSIGGGTPVITTTAGEFVFGGGALDLNKAENEYLVPASNFSFSTTDAWSVSFWARRRPGAGISTGMVVGDNTTTDSFIWLPDNSTQVQGLRFRPVGVGTGYNGDYATGHDTDFHHWVVVADGSGTLRVYRDNVDLDTISPTGGSDFDIKAIGSGYTGTNQIFDGQIDELYIFDEAIGSTTVGELFNNTFGSDTTPPTLAGSDIVDDRSGGPVLENSLVGYTVTFSEDMDAASVEAADFGNAGTAGLTIWDISEISPGVFRLQVSPTSTGTLRLQVNQDAVLSDVVGNPLNTSSAIADDTTIQVDARTGTTDPALIAYYSFDNRFEDDSGNNRHLTIAAGSPAITTTAGERVFGAGALDLESTLSDAEFLNLFSPIAFTDTDPWSVSFWVRRRAGSDDRQGMVLGDTANTADFIWATNNPSQVQGLRFRNQSGQDADFGGFPDDGQFHHWVVISDGAGNISAYRNNIPQTGVAIDGAFNITSVGHAYNATTFSMNGQIDELRIYDTAIDAAKVAELFNGEADTTPPVLTGSDFGDDQGGGPVTIGTVVTYTVSFNEDMDESTVTIDDFGNDGTASFVITAVTEISPGVFNVEVSPTGTGTLRLKVLASADLRDAAGNPLNTASAILDDTTITVNEPSGPAGVKRVRVFLLGGQSNADGRAAPSGLPTNPVNLQLPQDDVDFHENEAGGLTTLRPLAEFGPEITWGRCLADSLADGVTTRVAIIKYAVGGTSLQVDWKAGGDATTTNDGPRYVSFQGVVTAGMAALAATYPQASIEIEGMLWVQGERDVVQGFENNYAANLTAFIADVRATYGADLPFIISRLSILQTSLSSTGLAVVRAAQDAVAAADPRAAIIDTDTFGMKTDNLHFDAAGQQQLGKAGGDFLLDFYPFLSPLRIEAQPGGDLTLTVNDAFAGFIYTLRSSETLLPGSWQLEQSETATGSTVEFTVTPAPADDRRFYRVERELAP